jgi:hypothetical protein
MPDKAWERDEQARSVDGVDARGARHPERPGGALQGIGCRVDVGIRQDEAAEDEEERHPQIPELNRARRDTCLRSLQGPEEVIQHHIDCRDEAQSGQRPQRRSPVA